MFLPPIAPICYDFVHLVRIIPKGTAMCYHTDMPLPSKGEFFWPTIANNGRVF